MSEPHVKELLKFVILDAAFSTASMLNIDNADLEDVHVEDGLLYEIYSDKGVCHELDQLATIFGNISLSDLEDVNLRTEIQSKLSSETFQKFQSVYFHRLKTLDQGELDIFGLIMNDVLNEETGEDQNDDTTGDGTETGTEPGTGSDSDATLHARIRQQTDALNAIRADVKNIRSLEFDGEKLTMFQEIGLGLLAEVRTAVSEPPSEQSGTQPMDA